MKFGIIIGSIRDGRVGPQVANYVYEVAKEKFSEHDFKMLDIKDYNLPFVGTGEVNPAWSEDIAELDGYIFIAPEYNHSIPASLKNAIDLLTTEWKDKGGAIVSYGGLGGVRSAEHLRQVLGFMGVAVTSANPTLLFMTEFKYMQEFTPSEHTAGSIEGLITDLVTWTKGIKTVR